MAEQRWLRAEKQPPTIEEARNAVDVAILVGQMHEDGELRSAAHTAFVIALAASAPEEVTYLIQAAELQWDDFDGPVILLKLARARLDEEVAHG